MTKKELVIVFGSVFLAVLLFVGIHAVNIGPVGYLSDVELSEVKKIELNDTEWDVLDWEYQKCQTDVYDGVFIPSGPLIEQTRETCGKILGEMILEKQYEKWLETKP